MMQGMMGDHGRNDVGHGPFGLIGVLVIILVIAALIKYVFSW